VKRDERRKKVPDQTYSESAHGIVITRERALGELRAHGMDSICDILDFDDAVGLRNTYTADEVLAFLGY
jgi:hypothetical protein